MGPGQASVASMLEPRHGAEGSGVPFPGLQKEVQSQGSGHHGTHGCTPPLTHTCVPPTGLILKLFLFKLLLRLSHYVHTRCEPAN